MLQRYSAMSGVLLLGMDPMNRSPSDLVIFDDRVGKPWASRPHGKFGRIAVARARGACNPLNDIRRYFPSTESLANG